MSKRRVMSRRSVFRGAVAGLVIATGFCAADAQSTGGAPRAEQEQTPFTLHTQARIVLTDVTVTDRDGHPVHGLGRSAFHIFDNGHAQQLASFEEHRGDEPVTNVLTDDPAGVFSNAIVLHPPPVFNVIVIDTTTIGIADQMYLYQELLKFVRGLPSGQPVAIYNRGADYTVLVQNFTADHKLLQDAIQKTIPRLRQPGADYVDDADTLHQIAIYLGQYPGRKNVLWFSGGSTLFLRSDPTDVQANENMQPIYDELEASRIAIYPIDARGLTVGDPPGMVQQHLAMNEVAEATGGHAFYNNNGLSMIASQVLASDRDFYTLTYAPRDVRFDNSWHKVKVELDGSGYKLSYRRGYYDDGANTKQPEAGAGSSRKRLLAGGETAHEPDMHSDPIVFAVRVIPSSEVAPLPGMMPATPPKHGEIAYTLRYAVPAESVTAKGDGVHAQATLGAVVLAMNNSGRTAARVMQEITLSFDEQKAKSMPDAKLDFDQQINLPKGQDYLYVAVWDLVSGRLGTLQVPLEVTKTARK